MKSDFFAERLQEVLIDGQWVTKTNIKSQIVDLNKAQATQKLNNQKSIAEIVFHLNYFLEGIIKVFNGGPLDIRDKYSYDMTPILQEDDWEKLRNEFFLNSENIINQIKDIPDEVLHQDFGNGKYGTNVLNISALIEHSFFHLGQICLLRRMLT